MMTTDLTQARGLTKTISPAQHAVLDYGVAATFFAFGFFALSRHRPAAALAFVNGAMILGMSFLTDYPGGVFPLLSFHAHRTGDIAQAALAGVGPVLFGFGNDPEATYFYGQAASEAGVIAATDWTLRDETTGRVDRARASTLVGQSRITWRFTTSNTIFDEVAHRPWPMPDTPWLITPTRSDALFAHSMIARAPPSL